MQKVFVNSINVLNGLKLKQQNDSDKESDTKFTGEKEFSNYDSAVSNINRASVQFRGKNNLFTIKDFSSRTKGFIHKNTAINDVQNELLHSTEELQHITGVDIPNGLSIRDKIAALIDIAKKHYPEENFRRSNKPHILLEGKTMDMDYRGQFLKKSFAFAVDKGRDILKQVEEFVKAHPEYGFERVNETVDGYHIIYKGTKTLPGPGKYYGHSLDIDSEGHLLRKLALRLVREDGTLVKISQAPSIAQIQMIEDDLFRDFSQHIPEAKRVASELLTENPQMSTQELRNALKNYFKLPDIPIKKVTAQASTLSNSTISMIESMFRYYPEQIPKAKNIAENVLAKNPDATNEEIGIAIKEAFC